MAVTTVPGPYSILITEDDSVCRDTLRAIVEETGNRAVLAASGEEALEIVREAPIHLALLEMQMKSLNGLETLQLVRQTNLVLPCILVTADASEAFLRRALHARASSVLVKPVSKSVVLNTVVRALVRAYGLSTAGQPASDPAAPPSADGSPQPRAKPGARPGHPDVPQE